MKRYKKKSKRTGKYKSKLEATVAKRLGKKATYETETLDYVLSKRYKPDFIVHRYDGEGNEYKMYIEVKGYFRYEDQAKMRAVKLAHPSIDIRMFFPSDGKTQGSGMSNSEWCAKYGYPCAIGTIPKEWLI